MNRLLHSFVLCIILSLLTISSKAQTTRFGGPFTTYSYNNYGGSISIGGGGSFIIIKNFYIGIFGQSTSDLIKREVDFKDDVFTLKSRQTGFWVGYTFFQENKFSASVFNKVGIGQVYLNNKEKSLNYYDRSIAFTPNIEIAYRPSPLIEFGLSVFYEMYTGVNLYGYQNTDFNAFGSGLIIKFKPNN